MEFDAIVLAGGRAARLSGTDKAAIEVAGSTLLDRALAAVAGARRVVVVGDERPVEGPAGRDLTWVREDPAYGGPVAATFAGLDTLPGAGLVVVLAVDMPDVTTGTVRRLLGAVADDGAVLVDGGRRHLAMVVRAAALDAARPDPTDGAAMRGLWARLALADVPATGDEARDVDTPDDLPPKA